MVRLLLLGLTLALAGCGPDYSPNTYASTAVQQANKVEQGVIIGVRRVDVSASGTTGALTGGAAGGIAGSQLPVGSSVGQAFGALGGTVVGGLVGTTVEHATADTTAYEYIVRKPTNELVSVTQRDVTPMQLGEKVLVIAGNQARIVPDYTVPVAGDTKPAEPPAAAQAATAPGPNTPGSSTPGSTTGAPNANGSSGAPVIAESLGPPPVSVSIVPGLPTLLAPVTPPQPSPSVPDAAPKPVPLTP